MNALNKSLTALLFATLTTPALAAVTDNQVFAYAEANYASLFSGASTSGQFQQYNYRYYPATKNYLAVDSAKVIYILGPASNGNIQPVGPVSAFEGLITAWEAKQAAASGTTGTAGSLYTVTTTFSLNGVAIPQITQTAYNQPIVFANQAAFCAAVTSAKLGMSSITSCTWDGTKGFISGPTAAGTGLEAVTITYSASSTTTGGTTSSPTNSVTCNKSLYPSSYYPGGVGLRDATVAEVASYAGTLKSAALDPVTYTPTGAWNTIVVSPTGGITFKGTVEKVSSICMLTAYNELSFFFGTGSPLPELSVSSGGKGWGFTGTPQYSF